MFHKGRINLSATIFVPYDCDNNCLFCTSKKDYLMNDNFNIQNILDTINKIKDNNIIQEYVITGGEPFADIQSLKLILDIIKDKPVYINTTLPNNTLKESIELINSYDCIKGINVSRHIGFDFSNVANVEDLDKIKKSIRINTVITEKFTQVDFFKFCYKYGKYKRDINLRADYRKINENTLKNQDSMSKYLCAALNYISTESCLVCNTEYFSFNNEFLVSYHRGLEKSSIMFHNNYYINDIIIKQDGKIYRDWDCMSDKYSDVFEAWIFGKINIEGE